MEAARIWPTKIYGDETLDTVADISGKTIEELAVALSRINRYNGRGYKPYNVAQHSVLVSSMVAEKYKLHGLLHDIHEVCIGDINGVFKLVLGKRTRVLKRAEKYVQGRVLYQLGVDPVIPFEVHEADQRICDTEISTLNSDGKLWVIPHHGDTAMQVDIWDSETSAEMFVSFYNTLTGGTKEWKKTQMV